MTPETYDPSTGSGPRDHRGLRVLTLEECLQHLREAPVGRVAFLHEGDPVILPVTFALDGLDVVFRSTWGSKLEHARHAGNVAFEVDAVDVATRRGWSVVISGVAVVEYDPAELERLDALSLPTWAPPEATSFWIRVRTESVTGRSIEPRW
jgi:nitroimidazol reductase NimA-like FMN-containing flavoprotein (pyridoxamine 5'-phosphate oxidase superfamily)